MEGELAGLLREGSVANLAVQEEFLLKDISDLDDRYGRAAATAEARARVSGAWTKRRTGRMDRDAAAGHGSG